MTRMMILEEIDKHCKDPDEDPEYRIFDSLFGDHSGVRYNEPPLSAVELRRKLKAVEIVREALVVALRAPLFAVVKDQEKEQDDE